MWPRCRDSGGEAVLRAPRGDRAVKPNGRLALVAVLGALTATAPLSIDMYVPGFPAMGATLGASSSAVQLTMTAFLAGLVVGQLGIGPISDALGRRPLLVGGIVCYSVFSLACAVAPNVEVLIGARFLQGVSGAAGMVLARAVLTDRFSGADLPRYFAVLSQVLGVAPVVAPVLGGALLSVASWRLIFVVLSGVGAVLLVAVLRQVPESLPEERRRPGGLRNTLREMRSLAGRRAFLGYQLTLGFTSAALFSYISGSSFVFEELHGVTPTMYSLIFAVNAAGMLSAGFTFGRLSSRCWLNTLLIFGVGIAAVGASLQVALVLTVGETLAGTWVCLFVVVVGVALVIPSVMSIGQAIARDSAGAGSALLGGVQFLLGAAASPVVGFFGEASSRPMALIMLFAMAGAAVSLFGLARPWHGHGEPAR
ncbi:multidrug effflux MFS transporter [Streptomyces umbrinus]|uniref:multidrug effflux MFS transporter n=1 Tax=Streptomyces umbrinus TaxID=67370 RepID=UPI0034052854